MASVPRARERHDGDMIRLGPCVRACVYVVCTLLRSCCTSGTGAPRRFPRPFPENDRFPKNTLGKRVPQGNTTDVKTPTTTRGRRA